MTTEQAITAWQTRVDELAKLRSEHSAAVAGVAWRDASVEKRRHELLIAYQETGTNEARRKLEREAVLYADEQYQADVDALQQAKNVVMSLAADVDYRERLCRICEWQVRALVGTAP